MDGVAKKGLLKVVKWLSQFCTEQCTDQAIVVTIEVNSSNSLEIAEILFSTFPQRRWFELSQEFIVSRVEIVEWLLERAPASLIGCILYMSPWNWYLRDWLRLHHASLFLSSSMT